MANPAPKAPHMEQYLETLYGRTTAIQLDYCVICRKPATQFDNELAAKEYTLSGMCNDCQTVVFNAEED